jgi:ribonuclease HII
MNNTQFEEKLFSEGKRLIAGVDEVGRGPIAGPVVAACVILPPHFFIEGLTDSKQLTEKQRDYYFEEIYKHAIEIKYEFIDEGLIDQINILQASKLAMEKSIQACKIKPDFVLVDAIKLDISIPFESIIKGDEKSITIAAASVIAKVIRDRYMKDLSIKYPEYNFQSNKGYPTKYHIEAVKKYGILDIHRKSFSPIKEMLVEQISFKL